MKSTLQEAEEIINGPRREAYGPVEESFNRIAAVWNATLFKKLKAQLSAHDVAMCMIGLKLCREANAHSHDNILDLIGYAALAEKVAK